MKELYQAHMNMMLYKKDCEYRWTNKSMELNGPTLAAMRHIKRTIQLCLEFCKKKRFFHGQINSTHRCCQFCCFCCLLLMTTFPNDSLLSGVPTLYPLKETITSNSPFLAICTLALMN